MRNDKAKIYSLEIILFLSLFLALFVPNILKSRLIVAVFLTLYALVTLYVVKGKSKFSIYQRKEFLLLLFLAIIPVILSYTLMIFGSNLWDAIYYKFYEWWNNPFYLPSLNELREERQKEEVKKAEEEEDVNVEMK